MENLLTLLADYGLVAFAVFVVVAIGLRFVVSWFMIKNNIHGKNDAAHDQTRISATLEPKHHLIHRSTRYKIEVEIPNLDIAPGKPVKAGMIKDLMIIHMKSLLEACRDISSLDVEMYNSYKWANEVSLRVSLMVKRASNDAIDAGIPEAAVTKFSKWYQPTIDMLLQYISMISEAGSYPNNIARTNTIFFIMGLLLVTVVADAEKTLAELNGDISGKRYKGKVIEH